MDTPDIAQYYRADSADGLSDDTREYLDQAFLTRLENISVAHPKLLVVFSGGNALGKTTLAERIGHELQALVLENDHIKRCLLKREPGMSKDELNTTTWKYSMDLYRRLPSLTRNGLVVRDGVIHWYYDRILPIFEEQGYELFIISYDISREKRKELIEQRGDTPTTTAARLVSILDNQLAYDATFRKSYTPDFIFTEETLYDHDKAIEAIKQRLRQLGFDRF